MWDTRWNGNVGASGRDISRVRVLHLAEGVLIGWRRCNPEAAFAELVDTARQAGLSPLAVAGALVALASGSDRAVDDRALATARQRWGALLGAR